MESRLADTRSRHLLWVERTSSGRELRPLESGGFQGPLFHQQSEGTPQRSDYKQ
jgi:hypothetical protein